jgi:hypothetical protein
MAGTDPGNDKPEQCKKILEGWIATLSAGGSVKVPFPVYDTSSGTGNNAIFHIIGYATFQLWGWKFGNGGVYEYHNTATDPSMNAALSCSGGNDRCVIGKFVKFETTSSGGGGTGGDDLGTVDIRLIK